MASLVVRFRNETLTRVDLSPQPIKFGRAEVCDVVLRADSEISREHAKVWLDDAGRVVVLDLGSKNGTRVDNGDIFKNASRVAEHTIRVGEHEIEIVGLTQRPAGTPTVLFSADGETQAGGDTRFFPSSKRLDLSSHRLSLLMSLGERIGGTFERKQLLEQALDACCAALSFERGLIVVKTQRGDAELPVTRNVQTDETGAYKVSRTLINRALLHGERAVVNNPATDIMGNLSESLVRFPIRSALCVPILNRSEVLGAIYGDRVERATKYEAEDVDFLAAIAQQVGLGLANLRLMQQRLAAEKIEAELRQAREIQQALLPESAFSAYGIAIEGYNEPTSSVGGDYFDYFDLGDGRVGFVIADVTGHGLPAAILMSNLQAAVRVALGADHDLPRVAERINRLICQNSINSVFITGILGVVHTKRRLVEYVNAGHPHPICLGIDRKHADEENSLPFGIEPDEQYGIQTIATPHAPAGFLFYTDGLSEAFDATGAKLEVDDVSAALRRSGDFSPSNMLRMTRSMLREHLRDIPVADDTTLLAMHLA